MRRMIASAIENGMALIPRKRQGRLWMMGLCFLVVPVTVFQLSGCINIGVEWSELTFTRKRPNPADLIGTWFPTDATMKDLKEHGHYAVSTHQLILRADGTFSMVNMPDWWRDGFGQSKKGFESGEGTWQLYRDQNPWTVWAIELNFPTFVVPNAIHLRHQKPPYLIHMWVGDPDSGHTMLFERTK